MSIAQNPRASRRWEHQSHQQLQCGGFARAVRTEEAENLSFFDRQAQRTERKFRPLAPESDEIALFQIENFDCSHGYAWDARPLEWNWMWNLTKRIISNARCSVPVPELPRGYEGKPDCPRLTTCMSCFKR